MQYKNLFFLVMAFCLAPLSAPATTQAPFHSDSRMFPEEGTVHCINFFYNQVGSVTDLPKPENGPTFPFIGMEELYQLSLFEEEHTHAFAFKSPLFYIFDSIAPTVTTLTETSKTTANLALTFQHSNPQRSTVALIEFTKANNKITANITLYGLDEKPQLTFVYLLKSLMLGDEFAKRHAGKIMLGAGIGLTCLWGVRRYQQYKAHCINWKTTVAAIVEKIRTVPGWEQSTKTEAITSVPLYSYINVADYLTVTNSTKDANVFIFPLDVFRSDSWTTYIYIADLYAYVLKEKKTPYIVILIDDEGKLNSNTKCLISPPLIMPSPCLLLRYKQNSTEQTVVMLPKQKTIKVDESFDAFLARVANEVGKLKPH